MSVALANAKATHIFTAKILAIFGVQSFNDTLTNNIVSFEQLGPDCVRVCVNVGILPLLFALRKHDFLKDGLQIIKCKEAIICFQAFKQVLLFLLFLLFPTFFCVPTFPYFFLKMPNYPYFLVHKCLKWPKIVFFFLAHSKFVKIGSI